MFSGRDDFYPEIDADAAGGRRILVISDGYTLRDRQEGFAKFEQLAEARNTLAANDWKRSPLGDGYYFTLMP